MVELKDITNLLVSKRGIDFSGYRTNMLERRIQKRIYFTKCNNLNDYVDYLINHDDEYDNLIDVFTINVSSFFRNPIVFEYLNKDIIPELFQSKTKENINNIRIWSAGCSNGEEPYSISILISEFQKKEKSNFKINIFATDIDKNSLLHAESGIYNLNSIKEVKYGNIVDYFSQENNKFIITNIIKEMVKFSFFDLLDKFHYAPQDSIYGSFDIVFCRNVLIYFEPAFQQIIFDKLYKSLNINGYLVLGESEIPPEKYKSKFVKINNLCKIFKKIENNV